MSVFRSVAFVPLTVVLMLSLGSGSATAQQLVNADNGISERSWAKKSRPGDDEIIFAWMPTLPKSDALHAVVALCNRQDEQGNFRGKHKVTFTNLQMAGISTESFVFLSGYQGKMRRGLMQTVPMWDITTLVRSTLATEEAVLVGGEVAVSNKIAAFDLLTCGLAVAEVLDPGDLALATEAERLSYLRGAVEGILPGLELRSPGGRSTPPPEAD